MSPAQLTQVVRRDNRDASLKTCDFGMKKKKLLQKLLSSTRNVRFSEVVTCAEAFGFRLDRVNGSHHIFVHPGIPELLNLQNVKGKAKPYQVKQFLQLIETHNLQMEE